MKEIPLTRGMVALVDDDDYDWLMQWKWHSLAPGSYAVRRGPRELGQTTIYMHVVIGGGYKGVEVDHINLNKLDNRRSNLRLCTHTQNIYNRPPLATSASGYKGVRWHPKDRLWQGRISFRSKRISCGYFKNIEDAARAYDAKARELFGEFARLNFPLESQEANK